MTDREALREKVARLYIDKWGLSDYWLADAVINLAFEEAARVADGWVGCAEWSADTNSGYECASREIAAALRAYITPSGKERASGDGEDENVPEREERITAALSTSSTRA